MTAAEKRREAKKFANKWKDRGYEKGESNVFWLSLLKDVLGVEYPDEIIRFEERVKMDSTSFIDAFIPSTHVLIEQKSIDKNLSKGISQSDGTVLSPFQQAKRYSAELPYSERPRWIVTSNFKEFYIYDMEKPTGDPEVIYLKDLEKDYYRLNFLIDSEDENIKKAKEVSIKAGELVGKLYDSFLKEYGNTEDENLLHDLNILCVRLVFCFYAEDAGLFGRRNMFHDYLAKYKNSKSSFRNALLNLFQVLDQKDHERDPYHSEDLLAFPYVNGGLFEKEDIIIPRINDEIIDIILNQASASLDWSGISPTIFGGVFESTLNPETRRSGGMHYTSTENIHKVIDPLFMDGLREEFEDYAATGNLNNKKKNLNKLHQKIASLKFLDPAAGSGNFLTETYISLRKLENKILKELHGPQIMLGVVHDPIKVSISQFYGIEINDFAVSVAKTALWIAESQMIKETEDIVNMYFDFLPLTSSASIIEGNALTLDWGKIVPKQELDYIMGNPPFVGSRYMSKSQSKDLKELIGKVQGFGKLDYVVGWYKKSAELMEGTQIECAFVSTNSITQGEQVYPLWEAVFNKHNLKLNFAYQTFIWLSEAKDRAAVHCVIIGFSQKEKQKKYLYSSGSQLKIVDNINLYLVNAPNIIINGKAKPICNVPEARTGTRVGAQDYVFTEQEMKSFVNKEALSFKYFHEYLGAEEYLNNKKRYCLYLEDCPIDELKKMPHSRELISKVFEDRKAKNHKLKDFPRQYVKLSIPKEDYIFIPQMSSGRRKYVPMGIISKNIWTADPHFMIEKADLYILGILSSNVHNAWIRVVAGRLKSDYRYSNRIVYNNFPWPTPSEDQRKKIEQSIQKILSARKLYANVSLSDLYDEVTMPSELRKAHQDNDKAVMEAYGFDWSNMTEAECVAELMKMYANLTD